jgi:hypothetical protein
LIIPLPNPQTALGKTVSYIQTNDSKSLTAPLASVMAQVENPQDIPPFHPSDLLIYSTYIEAHSNHIFWEINTLRIE